MIRRKLRVELRRQLLQPRRRSMLQRRRRADIGQVVEVAHRAHPLRVGGHVAEPPAGHAERLAESRHHDGPLAHAVQRRQADVLRAVVDEVLVDLIGEDKQIVFSRRVGNRLQLRAGKDLAAGIGRRVHDDGARASA